MRRPNIKPTLIYWLVDVRPETLLRFPNGEPFYCGKTIERVDRRLQGHRREAVRYPERPIALRLADCREHVRIAIMETVPPDRDWVACERRWISILKANFPGVVNVSIGGEGVPGLIHSPESRAKMHRANIGKRLSAEHREKIRIASLGRTFSAETRAKLSAANKGKMPSEEAFAKLRAHNDGRPLSEAHRAKISAHHTGKKRSAAFVEKAQGRKASELARANMRAAQRTRRTSEAATHA